MDSFPNSSAPGAIEEGPEQPPEEEEAASSTTSTKTFPDLSLSSTSFSLSARRTERKRRDSTRSSFETELRDPTLDPLDTLDTWSRYITWTEMEEEEAEKEPDSLDRDGRQSLPEKKKKNPPVQDLLKRCIRALRDDERCRRDKRFLDVWIKYASTSKTPLQIFKLMYNKIICTNLPEFFLGWAEEEERTSGVASFHKVKHVFLRGEEMVEGTEAKKMLREEREKFQLRVRRQKMMMEKEDEDDEVFVIPENNNNKKKKKRVSFEILQEEKEEDGRNVVVASSSQRKKKKKKRGLSLKSDNGSE